VNTGVNETKAISNISKFNKMKPTTLLRVMFACKDLRDALLKNEQVIDQIYKEDSKRGGDGSKPIVKKKQNKDEKLAATEKARIEREARLQE
jgi:hypothetical protein